MEQSLMDKLTILADSAKYDVACTSSGASRAAGAGGVGSCYAPGCCHAFTADGRCVSLLKVLMTNCCSFDCSYCVNRKSNDLPRATFSPRELAELTMEFYRRNYIEGLFLSSAVLVSPDYTTERMLAVLRLLRGQLYSRQLRDTGRVESWFTDCGARMGQDIEGFVANARQQYVQAGLAEEQRAEAEAKQKAGRGRFRIRPASAFAPERAAYLVQPYLPRGMVSILGGVSAAGKTSLALDVCARLTRGAAFAPDTPPQPPATVLYLTAENDPNKVLRPRAEAMGADLDRLYFQDGASYSMGDEELAALCRVYRPALLVFDPIQSYLGQGVQMNRAEQVRPLLDHLGALAKELDMAVLLIGHMSKPGPGVCSALDRLLGSSDFRNAARSILIAGRDPEHPEVRVVAHAKNSLGQPGESQRYRICPQGTVAYDGPCTLTADAIIREAGTPATGNGRPSAALANAIEALEKQLSFVGWVEAGEVYRLCAERDISVSTIRRARVALGLKTLYIGNQPNRKNYWYQPELEEASVVADITNQNQQIQLA